MAELEDKMSASDVRKCVTNKPFLKARLMEVFGVTPAQPRVAVQQETPRETAGSPISEIVFEGGWVPEIKTPFDFEAEKQAVKIDWSKSWVGWERNEESLCYPKDGGGFTLRDSVRKVYGYELNTTRDYARWGTWLKRLLHNHEIEQEEVMLAMRERKLCFDLSQIAFFLTKFIWEDSDPLHLDCTDGDGNTFMVVHKGVSGICKAHYRIERKQPHFVISEFTALESIYRDRPQTRRSEKIRLYLANNPNPPRPRGY